MRKPKLLPPKPGPVARKERALYEGEYVARLPPPNHMLPIALRQEDERLVHGIMLSRKYCWPLLMALTKEDGKARALFFDPDHGEAYWEGWADHPPSWMDPHLFLRLALEDERVQKILRVAFKKNDPDGWKRLLPLFQEIFDNRYLPLVIERFEQASAVMARWLVAFNAQQELDQRSRKKPRG